VLGDVGQTVAGEKGLKVSESRFQTASLLEQGLCCGIYGSILPLRLPWLCF
jgi:hypothetical protein